MDERCICCSVLLVLRLVTMPEPPPLKSGTSWTRIDPYMRALQRRRSVIRGRGQSASPAREPNPPRLLLGTLPFLLLSGALAFLAGAIILMARPGAVRPSAISAIERVPPHELGTAPPGWFDEAKKEFR